MHAEKWKEWLVLYALDALSDTEKKQVEDWLAANPAAQKELDTVKVLLQQLSEQALASPPTHLLKSARAELRAQLYGKPATLPFFRQLAIAFAELCGVSKHSQQALKYKLALSAMLLFFFGIAVGYAGFFFTSVLPPRTAEPDFATDLERATVHTIEILSDSTYRIEFDVVLPKEFSGSVSNERTVALLARALEPDQPVEVREQVLGMLRRVPRLLSQPKICTALIRTVKYDPNAGLRQDALALLLQLPPTVEIDRTLLYVLMNDPNAGLRISAMDALARGICFQPDATLLNKLRERLVHDQNPYIRTNAELLLEELTEIHNANLHNANPL